NNLNKNVPVFAYSFFNNEYIFCVLQQYLLIAVTTIKNHINYQYNLLSTISGVDFLYTKYRFNVVYDLLSIKYNSRIRLKVYINEITSLFSITSIFKSAN